MSERAWKLFIEDILECIGKIEKYIEGMEFKDFETDEKTIDAVVRNLEVVGEASKNIPENVKARYSDVYWKGVVGLRNRIIHEYFGVDLKIIWYIVKEELLTLKKQMERILEKAEG
ncbi:MAG: hypothetical protein COS87_03260 [Chloroflexi bacterium CG07_land_8_20_14_0_80_45_17]|nr:MAG: hypothetical protein COS87_03260 [Chloroflexi bacterium CG07_land_8_20_14_0_80_45_17]